MVAIVNKGVGILLRPVETFRQLREESLGDAFVYYGLLLIVYAILSSLFSLAGYLFVLSWIPPGIIPSVILPSLLLPFMVLGILVVFIIGLIVGGVILHLFVYLVGGRKGLEQTLKAAMYGTTPVFVFGWIPLIGFLALIYALVLEILAVRELHEISTGRALLAVLLPFLLILVLIILALSFLLIVSSTSGSTTVPEMLR
jgi:hypothetical protein